VFEFFRTEVCTCFERARRTLPESVSLPSAWLFAECFFVGHSAKKSLPRAVLGKVLLSVMTTFTESRNLGIERHSAKISLPSAKHSVNGDARQRVVGSRL
jgi:hypothetical protein